MKAGALVVAFISILFCSSCQKEITGDIITSTTDTTIVTNPSYRVKTYKEAITSPVGNIVTTFNLTYDAAGRITGMFSTTNTGDKFIYQYKTNNTFTMDLYNSNVLSIHEDAFINSLGLVDSTIQYNDTKDTTSEKYVYNAAKVLVQQKEYEISGGIAVLSNTTNLEYDSKGNVIKESSSNSLTTYTYGNLVNNLNMGLIYYAQSKNLPETTTVTSGGIETLKHTYTFDSLNRLFTATTTGSNATVTRTYTY